MLLNLTDVLNSEDKVEEHSTDYEPDTFTVCGRTASIVRKEPFRLTFQNMGKGKARINGSFSCELLMECDRCLKDVRVPLDLRIEENLSSEEIEHPADADSLSFMEGFVLDTDRLLGSEILINWPVKVLCREDCRGICRQCGKDLNLGECGCDTFVPDPRMAVIHDIFNASKEV